MDYITVSAKTLDDAITEALIQLGVTSDRLDYVVIEKGSAGFLGIGMKQAVIKARIKEEEKSEPIEEEKKETVKEENIKEIKKETKKENKKEHKKENRKNDAVQIKENKKEVKLEKIEEATVKACEDFIVDVLKAMKMENVNVTSEIDEEGALSLNMEGDNMGILIGTEQQGAAYFKAPGMR